MSVTPTTHPDRYRPDWHCLPDEYPTSTAGAEQYDRRIRSARTLRDSGYLACLPDAPDAVLISDHQAARPTIERLAADMHGATVNKRTARGGHRVMTGTVTTADGRRVDIEHAASEILEASNWDHQTMDVPRIITDPFLLIDRTVRVTRPDAVAWRGTARYRPTSHRRVRIVCQANGTARYAQPGETSASVVTATARMDGLAWPDRAATVVTGWTAAVRIIRAADRITPSRVARGKRVATVTPATQTGGAGTGARVAPGDRQTAVNGRVTSVWQASPRSLVRMVDKAGVRGTADVLANVLRTSAIEHPVPLNGATVTTDGVTVDDGRHGAVPILEWSRRAALAGVTA